LSHSVRSGGGEVEARPARRLGDLQKRKADHGDGGDADRARRGQDGRLDRLDTGDVAIEEEGADGVKIYISQV